MRKLSFKALSFALILSTLSMSVTNVSAAKTTPKTLSSTITTEGMQEKRSNVVYLEGKPGATHLVYTYKENNTSYKVIEDASKDFTYVDSTTYVKNEKGNYVTYTTQEFSIASNGNAVVSLTEANGNTENFVISPSDVKVQDTPTLMAVSKYDWITETSNGSTHFKNITISVIIAEIGYIATLASGPIGGAITTGVSTVAEILFNLKAKYVYYHKVYNWKHSDRNYLVIEETEYTTYYSDKKHKKFLSYTYSEWRDK